jgi:DNA-directed RNA polymerase specialized sigma24 family protein
MLNKVPDILTSDEFRRSLRNRMPHGVDVEDVLGRTWERARGGIPPSTDPIRWLRRIAVNVAKDDAKAEARRRRRERRAGRRNHCDQAACNHDPDDSRELQGQGERSHDGSPTAGLERREQRRAIVTAIRAARLSRDHRCALWACLRDRVGDLARRRGIPQVTVRVWAKRARDALRPHLEQEGLDQD